MIRTLRKTRFAAERRTGQAGFTLIELMIAIAIVGVLAAIAVPAFANYLARARVSEAINYAQQCKTGFVEFYSTRGALPNSLNEANCPDLSTENVASVVVTNNPPSIRMNLTTGATSPLPAAVRGHIVVLQPLNQAGTRLANGDVIESWRCAVLNATGGAAAQTALDLMPAICRNNNVL